VVSDHLNGVGDEIFGYVRRVVMQAPTSYGPAPVVELELPRSGQRISIWLFHKVLRQSFERERVRLGELVLIRYLGKKHPEGGGNAYDNYRLVVDRKEEGGEPDWGAMAERYGDESDRGIVRRGDPDPGPDESFIPSDDDIPF
jgi:hypothetical protein